MEVASPTALLPEKARLIHLWRRMLWIACGIPLVHTVLLFTVAHPESRALQLLRPLGTLYAAMLLFLAAYMARGERRRCWASLGVSILGGAIYSFARAGWDTPMTALGLQLLLLVIYGCALGGFAFYFHQNTRFIGNIQRMIIGAITVAFAGFMLLNTVLPTFWPTWDWSTNVPLTFIAFDLGILFAFAIVHQRHHSPSTFMAILATSCLLFADTANAIVNAAPWGAGHRWIFLPIYTLHAALLAFNGHLDVLYPVEDLPQQTRREWLVWGLAPLGMVLAALLADKLLNATTAPALAVLLVGMILVYSVISELDYQRANRELEELRHRAYDQGYDEGADETISDLRRHWHDQQNAHATTNQSSDATSYRSSKQQ